MQWRRPCRYTARVPALRALALALVCAATLLLAGRVKAASLARTYQDALCTLPPHAGGPPFARAAGESGLGRGRLARSEASTRHRHHLAPKQGAARPHPGLQGVPYSWKQVAGR